MFLFLLIGRAVLDDVLCCLSVYLACQHTHICLCLQDQSRDGGECVREEL